MLHYILRSILFAGVILLPGLASATTIPRLSFEEMTDTSDLVVSGRVTRSWASWDKSHKYIWTHYQLAIRNSPKGVHGSTVEFAEPGGVLDGLALIIPGAVSYQAGEDVFVFLQRMPNGYLRTTGWGQGKYRVDGNGRLHADASLRGVEMVDTRTPRTAAAASPRSLDGMSLSEIGARVASRAQAVRSRGEAQ